MRYAFPGMDPWLEHPALWPDVHNSLIAAIRDELTPLVAPAYFVAIERRTYLLKPDDVVFIGRPDLAVASRTTSVRAPAAAPRGSAVVEVDVPMADEVGESFLEIHEVETRDVVAILELLSPANKLHARGRDDYERKRGEVFRSRTSLVEIDLLRAGEPMPVVGEHPARDYRVLVSGGDRRPRARLWAFDLRDAIPPVPIPLAPGAPEPLLELGRVLEELYARARFDLRLDYDRDPVPPLRDADREWAREMVVAAS